MARFLVPALMVVCFGMRFFASTTVPMTYDEAMIVTASARISLQPGAVNLPMDGYGHPAGELYLARLGTVLLGHNLAGFRFVSVVLGAATCWIMFALVRRVWGFWPAALTLFLLCFNGFHIGVSRFAVEYTYLFFVALAIYLFWRAVHEERPGLLVAAGATVGVGAFTSEHTFLLLPVFAAYLLLDREKRTWYRRWQTYAGVALAILIYSPDVYWTLTHPGDLALADGASEFDVGDQISRLRPGRLSAAPLALYIPPLYYKLSERLSEFPVMSVVGGVTLLVGVLHGMVVEKHDFARLLLVIFWLVFAVFTLSAGTLGEYRWVAMTLFAAAALAGRMLWRVCRRGPLCVALVCIPLVYIAAFGVWVANHSINCYFSPLVTPSAEQFSDCRAKEDGYVRHREDFDFPSLMGSPLFPARYRRYYLDRYLLGVEVYYVRPPEDDPGKVLRMLDGAARIAPDDPRVREWQRVIGASGEGTTRRDR